MTGAIVIVVVICSTVLGIVHRCCLTSERFDRLRFEHETAKLEAQGTRLLAGDEP